MRPGYEAVEEVIQLGLMPVLEDVWNQSDPELALCAIGVYINITWGNREHINAVCKVPRVMTTLMGMLKVDSRRKNAVRALFNIISKGAVEHVHYLLDNNVVAILCSLLLPLQQGHPDNLDLGIITDTMCVLNVLLLGRIVDAARISEAVAVVVECGGASAIKELHKHPDWFIANSAGKLVAAL